MHTLVYFFVIHRSVHIHVYLYLLFSKFTPLHPQGFKQDWLVEYDIQVCSQRFFGRLCANLELFMSVFALRRRILGSW